MIFRRHIFYRMKLFLKGQPTVYAFTQRYKRNPQVLVKRDTDLALNGYPRSGNTFLYVLLHHLNPKLKISHHSHTIAMMKQAKRFGVPSVVLLRHPLEAASSYVLRENVDPDCALREYIWFNGYVSQEINVYVLDFRLLVNNPDQAVRIISDFSGVSLPNPPDWAQEVEEVITLVRKRSANMMSGNDGEYAENHLSVPSAGKEERKQPIKNELKSSPLLEEAELLYRQLLNRAEGGASF